MSLLPCATTTRNSHSPHFNNTALIHVGLRHNEIETICPHLKHRGWHKHKEWHKPYQCPGTPCHNCSQPGHITWNCNPPNVLATNEPGLPEPADPTKWSFFVNIPREI
ncbi:uncharacterized protein BDZ99DRAFT_469749 [Mytilinidion resinicola]|uniref:CCHC-type domain-containing protein n=1 Tax=Mytilinidion resinicola TaxID=574789 RepID=A0A6A6XXN6_9PEZI|nr:uncharacterized protein BDZ99DRAFT_469749 [Mytilinidion resinicola]KAF2801316.1 hypothetical protein BDZ99DRAFT_469749 [Mytilinidion resinicola]